MEGIPLGAELVLGMKEGTADTLGSNDGPRVGMALVDGGCEGTLVGRCDKLGMTLGLSVGVFVVGVVGLFVGVSVSGVASTMKIVVKTIVSHWHF